MLNSPKPFNRYNLEKKNSDMLNSFPGDSNSKVDKGSIREVDLMFSEKKIINISSEKPYVKKDLQIINKIDGGSSRDRERKWN